MEFVKWLVKYAEDFEIIIDGEYNILRFRYRGRQNYDWVVDIIDISEWCFYPTLLHRAWDGYNRKEITTMNKDKFAASQDSWYGVSENYNQFLGIPESITMQEKAMEKIMFFIYKRG